MALSIIAERALTSNKSASIIHEDRDSAMDVRIWWLLQKVAYPQPFVGEDFDRSD
jgi:hypothetical protein